MGAMEVFLIITAVIVIAVSFCIKEKSDKNEDEKKSGQDEVKAVTQEMIKEEIQNQLAMISDDMLENTEAKLDKIANQKIMAVGNYSEDVLKNIEENHNEVMFLYNMLNDKETTLKNTVRDIEAVKVSVRKMADNVENDVQAWENEIKLSPEEENVPAEDKEEQPSQEAVPEMEDAEEEDQRSNKEKILELYRQGKSNIEIAKHFLRGLGAGILLATIVLFAVYSYRYSDSKIIQRAKELGMVYDSKEQDADDEKPASAAVKETTTELETKESQAETTTEPETKEPSAETTTEPEITTQPETTTAQPATKATTAAVTGENTGDSIKVTIPSGTKATTLAQELENLKVVESAEDFKNFLIENNYTHRLLSGEFYLNAGMSYEEIISVIGY